MDPGDQILIPKRNQSGTARIFFLISSTSISFFLPQTAAGQEEDDLSSYSQQALRAQIFLLARSLEHLMFSERVEFYQEGVNWQGLDKFLAELHSFRVLKSAFGTSPGITPPTMF